MSDGADPKRESDAPISGDVNSPDARVEASPSSALRGTAHPPNGNGVADGPVWEEPPVSRKEHGRWLRALAPLVDRPGAWARVHSFQNKKTAQAIVSQIKRGGRGTGIQMPLGRWEAVARAIPESTLFGVWARYLGPEESK